LTGPTDIPKPFIEAAEAVKAGGGGITLTGLPGGARGYFVHALVRLAGRPLLVVSSTQAASEELYGDYRFFASINGAPDGAYFPPLDVLPYDSVNPDPAILSKRRSVLEGVHSGDIRVVFLPVKALMYRLPPPESLLGAGVSFTVRKGEEFGHEKMISGLMAGGYERVATVRDPGEFTVRGGIVDVFATGSDAPVRAEFFGDEVESLRRFDPDTQRSTGETDELTVRPAHAFGPTGGTLDDAIARMRDEAVNSGLSDEKFYSIVDALKEGRPVKGREFLLPFFHPDMTDVAGYFTEAPVAVVDRAADVDAECEAYYSRVEKYYQGSRIETPSPPPGAVYMDPEEVERLFGRLGGVGMETLLPAEGSGRVVDAGARSASAMRLRDDASGAWPRELEKTPLNILGMNVRRLSKDGGVNLVCPAEGRADRLMDLFAETGVPAERGGPSYRPGPARIMVGELSAGFMVEEPQTLFLSSADIFGETAKRTAPAPKTRAERFISSISELGVGDFVVHADHGIGRYMGMERLRLMGVDSDFLDVTYDGGDRLYVPVAELGKLSKYIGPEGGSVKLQKLGGTAWEKARSRAKKAAEDIAAELVELYARRSVAGGRACPPDDHIYSEMESSFEYEETPDQMRAIQDVKGDLESERPMDRLVCGDVGYGKTEVALRAAFKVALDGRQAALLAPTTLLASQHLETFTGRLSAYPVRVEMLSRFTTPDKKKEVLAGLKAGTVDIVIGTHRLLQKDVEFMDLGLIIVDEEHRFGVKHKEKLKAMRAGADVLTLTATPIPRTLQMSLSGIRDLSVMETPPPDRQPIKTILTRFDRAVIKDAVMRELERGGQVFFVHNRIESIFSVGKMLQGLVPEASVAVAHGRMHESALEKVVGGFVKGDYDVLLSTSIIESGLDIPRANTIIIDRADRFGLADLYQLRGRVGRSGVRAYAYLLVPGGELLTEAAEKRLRALTELTELGSGFRLALHDLEIRGAGNVLGSAQSGHIAAVGFEMYTRLLEEAVAGLRGEEVEEQVETSLDLKVSAYLPDDYVPDTAHRLGVYKRLAGAKTVVEVEDIGSELSDRFGKPPEPARRLLELTQLKVMARDLKVASLELVRSEVKLIFSDKVDITPDKLLTFLNKMKKRVRYVPQYSLFVKRPPGGWEALYGELKYCLNSLA